MIQPDLNQKKLNQSIVIENWEDVEKSPVMKLHFERYNLTKRLVGDRVESILDAGCGTGYGYRCRL